MGFACLGRARAPVYSCGTQRVHNEAQPESWEIAARRWDDLERIPAAIRCRWRQAEAMVTSGEDRSSVMVPLLYAFAEATRLRAQPLIKEIENLARGRESTPQPPPNAPPQHRNRTGG